tara:strand:- start:241 stop:360 length:120 start_codon:yes stop_codon:yes gene_type:complete
LELEPLDGIKRKITDLWYEENSRLAGETRSSEKQIISLA